MGRIHVTITPDGMQASARIAPGPVAPPSTLREALTAAGVVHGLDERACDMLAQQLADPTAEQSAVVARGTAPVPGRDGTLESKLPTAQAVGRRDARDNIDYRERDLLHPAEAEQCIARIVPPTDGSPGRDVRGRRLVEKHGKAHRQRIGNGVRIEGNHLFAITAGVVMTTDRLLDVVPLYTHSGDVDYRSGNLRSKGSLRIQGDVTEGFTATADGDIAIDGLVQGGGVAAGGSVHICKGVLGHDETVRADLDITCRHATSARLVAGRDIHIADQVIDSNLQAQSIRVIDGRGTVRGSELRARDCIEVGTVGSPAGTIATLAVGDLLQERAELAKQTIATARADRGLRGGAGDRARKGLRASVKANDTEIALQLALRRRRREVLGAAQITVRDTCHAGVVLRFGEVELRPTGVLRAVRFHFDLEHDTIVSEPL